MSGRPTFYVDRCLGKTVPRELRAAGALVEAHDDHFAQNALDDDWIPQVTARGWVILTKDKNIRRAGGERETVLLSNSRVITLASGNMRGAAMAALFVSRIAEMEQLAASHPPPFVAVLGTSGVLQVVLSTTPPPAGGDDSSGDEQQG